MTRITWNEQEKNAVAEASLELLCSKLPKQNPTEVNRVTMQSYYGFLTVIVPEAQRRVLPLERHRIIAGLHTIPWIHDYVTAISTARRTKTAPMLAPAPVAAPVAEINMSELIAQLTPLITKQVIAQLSEDYTLIPRTKIARMPTPVAGGTTAPMARKPQVWMFGLLPNQQREIETAWGKSFRFKFIEASRSVKFEIPTGEWAIMMGGFVDHAQCDRVRAQVGSRYLAVQGGVTSLKKSLNDLNSRFNHINGVRA